MTFISFEFCVEIEWQQKAREELGEEAVMRKLRLRQLNELIVGDADFPNARHDDAFLLRFLRAKKFDVEKSFRMVSTNNKYQSMMRSEPRDLEIIELSLQMQKYFKMKKDSPDLFRVSPTSEMHDILKMQIQQTLPDRDVSGSVVYVFRVRK